MDESEFIDWQKVKVQENPDEVGMTSICSGRQRYEPDIASRIDETDIVALHIAHPTAVLSSGPRWIVASHNGSHLAQ